MNVCWPQFLKDGQTHRTFASFFTCCDILPVDSSFGDIRWQLLLSEVGDCWHSSRQWDAVLIGIGEDELASLLLALQWQGVSRKPPHVFMCLGQACGYCG